MKQIFTLLFAAGVLNAANAQSRPGTPPVVFGGGNGKNYPTYPSGDRDVILGGGNGGNNYPTYPGNYPSGNNGQYEVDRINREYDAKIQSIRNNPYLSNGEKQRAVQQLERDRQRRLQQAYGSNNNRGYDRNNDCDDDRNTRNNRGWAKNKARKWKNRG